MRRLRDPKRMKKLLINVGLRSHRKLWQRLIPILSIFALVAVVAAGQTVSGPTSGVYLTAADYQNHHLTSGGDSAAQATPVKLRLTEKSIEVQQDSKSRRFAKNKVFGFRSDDGRDYRFGSNQEYEIVEAKELYIYTKSISALSPRGRESQGGKSDQKHYFSLGAKGQIRDLTLANLKQAIPKNHKFHDLLDTTFGEGRNVSEYDDFHKMFKVNRVLIASRE